MFGKLKFILISLTLIVIVNKRIFANCDSLSIVQNIQSAKEFRKANQTDKSLNLLTSLLLTCKDSVEKYISLKSFINHRIGVNHFVNSNYPAAIQFYKTAYNIRSSKLPSNHEDVCKSQNNLAWAYYYNGNYEKAVETFENLTNKEIKNKKDLNKYYNGLAESLNAIGDIDRAIECINKAIRSFEEMKDTFNLIVSYNDRGKMQSKRKELDLSILDFEKVLALTNGRNLYNYEINAINNIAIRLNEKKNYQEAIKYLNRAEKVNQSYKKDSTKTAANYNNLAIAYNGLSKYNIALDFAKKNLDLRQKIHNTAYHPDIALGHETIADVYLKKNQYDKALYHYHQSILTLIPSFKDQNVAKNPSISVYVIHAKTNCINPIAYKGETFLKMYQKDQKLEHLEKAMDTYLTLDSLLIDIKQNFQEDGSKFLIAEEAFSFYEKAIYTAFQLYKKTTDEKYKKILIDLFEENKASVFYDGLQTKNATQYGNVPKKIIKQENLLAKKISAFEKKAYDKPENTAFKDSIFELKKDRKKLIDNIESISPKYYQLKYQNTNLEANLIQKELADDQILIEYFLGDSTLYTIALTPSKFEVFQKPIPKNFRPAFNDFLASISIWESQSSEQTERIYLEYGYFFYELLLSEPIKFVNNENLKRITIVPDGILGYLPFEILLETKYQGNWIDRDLPLVIKKYAFNYLVSSRQAFKSTYQSTLKAKYGFAGFGCDYSKNNADHNYSDANNKRSTSLSKLPFAVEEIEKIKKDIGGRTWTNDDATISNFMTYAKDYGIIHLSLHGSLNEDNPMFSHFVFSKGKDTDKDNYLYASDLYNMELSAELAVLSACNTGQGTLKKGEGIMSLSRGFAYAGCPSLVMNLWSISDHSSFDIMSKYYNNLKEGMTKDVALQKAKLYYINNNAAFATPIYWASLIAVGDDQPIDPKLFSKNRDINPWLLSLAGLSSLLILFFMLKKKSKKES